MTPIPLTDPSGTVRAYACGRCFSAFSRKSGVVHADSAGRVDRAARWSLRRADECCRCYECHVELNARTFGRCEACEAKWEERIRWAQFAESWRDIGDAAYHEIASEDEWRAYQAALEELDR